MKSQIPIEYIDHLPVLYVALSAEGEVRHMNRALLTLLGWSSHEVLGLPFLDRFVPTDAQPRAHDALRRLTRSGAKGPERCSLVARCGTRLEVEWHSSPLAAEARGDDLLELIGIDATQQHDSVRVNADGLRLEAGGIDKLLNALEHVADHVAITDSTGRIEYVNRAFETLSGWPREQALGRTLAELWAGRVDPRLLDEFSATLDSRQGFRGDFVNRDAQGELFFDEVSVSPLLDPDGHLTHVVTIGRDATGRHLSDPTTGLQTRALLLERTRLAIARSRRSTVTLPFALLFLDVDRFKSVNDTYGIAVGDQIILELGRRIQAAVREVDAVAQVGHLNRDEFAVLVEDLRDPSDACHIAERIQDHVRQPILLADAELVLRMSIGIASSRPHYEQPEELLRDAETAMELAKQDARESTRMFDAELHRRSVRRVQLGTELRRALSSREITVSYQPIISLGTRTIAGTEALARWDNPQRGSIPPLDFIPAAENSGLIVSLGMRVLRDACLETRCIHERGFSDLTVAVNLSARQFRDPGLVRNVAEILEETGLHARFLKLELTESTAADDPEQAICILSELKSLGIQILMDDFGTGYSSLSYLTRFPLDQLKIDRSFIARIPGSPHDTMVASTIVAMAHSLGFGVIAEGVETREQLDFLTELGCEQAQGFYFSQPLLPSDLLNLLEHPSWSDHGEPEPRSRPNAVSMISGTISTTSSIEHIRGTIKDAPEPKVG